MECKHELLQCMQIKVIVCDALLSYGRHYSQLAVAIMSTMLCRAYGEFRLKFC